MTHVETEFKTSRRFMPETGWSSMEHLRSCNDRRGHHYFEPGTLRFFKSRIGETIYGGRYFTTSEQGPNMPRRYSVREAMPDASVQTIGEFQAFATGAQAIAAARRLGRITGSEHLRELIREYTYGKAGTRPEKWMQTFDQFADFCGGGYGFTPAEFSAARDQVEAES